MVKILLPTGPDGTGIASGSLAPRLASLEGARLGIVNNRWACMNSLTRLYQDLLPAELGVREVEVHAMAATEWLSDHDVRHYAGRWDAALVGVGH